MVVLFFCVFCILHFFKWRIAADIGRLVGVSHDESVRSDPESVVSFDVPREEREAFDIY
jgi:hypothetical protein